MMVHSDGVGRGKLERKVLECRVGRRDSSREKEDLGAHSRLDELSAHQGSAS